jgi:hypothetical protein
MPEDWVIIIGDPKINTTGIEIYPIKNGRMLLD